MKVTLVIENVEEFQEKINNINIQMQKLQKALDEVNNFELIASVGRDRRTIELPEIMVKHEFGHHPTPKPFMGAEVRKIKIDNKVLSKEITKMVKEQEE